jgi:hypothetical protein
LAYFLIVVGVSDFAMGSTRELRKLEPDGAAAGLNATHRSKGKHFQRASATVLCGTVNPKASGLLRKLPGRLF